MRKWIDAVTGEAPKTASELSEAPFGFLKSLEKTAPAKRGGFDQNPRPAFGKRGTAAAPAQAMAPKGNENMSAALAEIGHAVAWGGVDNTQEIIAAAAKKHGVNANLLRAAITPDMIRNWQNNYD